MATTSTPKAKRRLVANSPWSEPHEFLQNALELVHRAKSSRAEDRFPVLDAQQRLFAIAFCACTRQFRSDAAKRALDHLEAQAAFAATPEKVYIDAAKRSHADLVAAEGRARALSYQYTSFVECVARAFAHAVLDGSIDLRAALTVFEQK